MSGKQSGRYLILSSANEFVYNRIRIFSLLFFRNNECYRPKKKRALNFFFRNDISATKKLKYLQKLLKTTVYQNQGETRPKTSRQNRSKIKVMLTVSFDYRGIVHYEFQLTGQIVNKDYYLSILCCLQEAIRRKRLGMWREN